MLEHLFHGDMVAESDAFVFFFRNDVHSEFFGEKFFEGLNVLVEGHGNYLKRNLKPEFALEILFQTGIKNLLILIDSKLKVMFK